MTRLLAFIRYQESIRSRQLRLANGSHASKDRARRILRMLGWTPEQIAQAERKGANG